MDGQAHLPPGVLELLPPTSMATAAFAAVVAVTVGDLSLILSLHPRPQSTLDSPAVCACTSNGQTDCACGRGCWITAVCVHAIVQSISSAHPLLCAYPTVTLDCMYCTQVQR